MHALTYLVTGNVQTLRHYNQGVIAEHFDSEGNTLGHISALNGSVELFKVVIKVHCIFLTWIKTFAFQVVFPLHKELSAHVKDNKEEYKMFWALVLENEDSHTPLMVAIDNNHHK